MIQSICSHESYNVIQSPVSTYKCEGNEVQRAYMLVVGLMILYMSREKKISPLAFPTAEEALPLSQYAVIRYRFLVRSFPSKNKEYEYNARVNVQ